MSIEKINIKTAESIIDFSGGQEDLEPLAAIQMEGAVALHNMIADDSIGLGYLADEVGMGKTYIALGVVALMRYFNPSLRVLYLCPSNNVQDKWIREYRSFTENNLRVSQYRIRTPQGKPAIPYVNCRRVRDLIEHSASGYCADFFVGKGMFSMGMGDDPANLNRNLKDLKHILPGYTSEEIEKGNLEKEAVKDEFAKALNHILPTFDLVIIDESHNFKHSFGSSDRNRVLSQVLGVKDEGKFIPRIKNALLLSATPYDRNINHLRNQLNLVGKSQLIGAVESHQREEIVEKLKFFMVRRLNEITINGVKHTRNMYRREARKTAAIDLKNDEQKLVTALMQKKVGELLGKKGGNPSFQTGMFASFESYQQTAKSGPVEFDGDKSEKISNDARDRHVVGTLVDSYKDKNLGRTLPHPKMDSVSADLARKMFEEGRKQLVFVRRVKSVRELKEKLDEHYNQWLFSYIKAQLQGDGYLLITELENLYLEKSRNKDNDITGAEIEEVLTPSNEHDEERDEVSPKRKNDTFFTWFFMGQADPEAEKIVGANGRSWRTPEQIRKSLYLRKDRSSTLLEINWAYFLSDFIEKVDIKSIIANAESLTTIAVNASHYIPATKKDVPVLDVFKAVQAAFVEFLIEELDYIWLKPIQSRFLPIKRQCATNTISESQVSEYLLAPSLYQALHEAEMLDSVFPLVNDSLSLLKIASADTEKTLRKLEVHRYLIDILIRTAHGVIDLYIARLKLGSSGLNQERRKLWMQEFCGLLDKQRKTLGFSTWQELTDLAANLDLVIKVNIPDIYEQNISEYRRYLSYQLNPIQPIFGASGETLGQRSAQARKFRMPGYPLALISTDVFQEGEDLHTFCSDVVHYGLSGSPVSIEQKVGRVDRVNSLAQRRLSPTSKALEKDFIQVEFPFISESIELFQVRRLCSNINEFIESLHDFDKNYTSSGDENDTSRDIVDRSEIPEQIMSFLESPYKVDLAQGTLLDRTKEVATEGEQRTKVVEHICSLVDVGIQAQCVVDSQVINAIKHSNFDVLNHLHPEQSVIQLLSARASSDLLLSWTRRLNKTEIKPIPAAKGALLEWLKEICWPTYYRFYRVLDKNQGDQIFCNSEMLVGDRNVTQDNDIDMFIRRNLKLTNHDNNTVFGTLNNEQCIRYLNDINTNADLFGQTTSAKYFKQGDIHLVKFHFNVHDEKLKRTQTVEIREHEKRCIMLSRALDSILVDGLTYKQLIKHTLDRNRRIDLVDFLINPSNELIGRVVHPIESLDKEELYYSIFCLASETDRLEYVLSSDDAN